MAKLAKEEERLRNEKDVVRDPELEGRSKASL